MGPKWDTMRHHKATWNVIVCRDYWIKCSIYLYPLTSVHSRSVAVLSVILVINLRNSLLTKALPVLVVATLQIPHTVVLNFDTVPEAAITCEQQMCSTRVTIQKVTNKSILSPWLWDTICEWTGNEAKLCIVPLSVWKLGWWMSDMLRRSCEPCGLVGLGPPALGQLLCWWDQPHLPNRRPEGK